MNRVSTLLVITLRASEETYLSLLERHGARALLSLPCQGTASQSILSLLGLAETEKTMMLTIVRRKTALHLLDEMVENLGINLPGQGIALTVPVESIGGMRAMNFLLDHETMQNSEVDTMEDVRNEYPFELIVAIARRGYSDAVMAAARTCGAAGGTIVHAKGVATETAANLFGISLAEERELILIAARRENRDEIMHAIMAHAGSNTEAKAVVLSLPVDHVVGLRSILASDSSDPNRIPST